MFYLYFIVINFVSFMTFSTPKGIDTDMRSPYYQHLVDCKTNTRVNVMKRTALKGIVCPMIKDEEGFLSEWTAFYEMMGFDHVIFYDNNSTSSFAELQPWIDRGFVTIISKWWSYTDVNFKYPKQRFWDMMKIKMMAEVDCKRRAIEMGIDIFVSVDMDEFVFPLSNHWTVVDELAHWFNTTTRGMVMLGKFQFPPTPHLLEPLNLLTIEAYQTRMRAEGKMNYYTSVKEKVALRLLGGDEYNNRTYKMLTNCCDFHGCGNYKFHNECPDLIYSETGKITGKHRRWMPGPHIHHYARSLEKYMLKQKTWDTAGSDRGYDMYTFLDRTLGFEFDNSAVEWGCQLRELLRNRTGQQHFVRPGDFWYRNPEFGRAVSDPHKRGRFGRGDGKRLGPTEMNPYPPGDTYQLAHKAYEAPAVAKG